MAKVYTYPHWEINVIDNSIYTPLARETLPLFRPIFFMRAQSGLTGVPQWCNDYTSAVAKYGEGTFDQSTKYFSREALYLNNLFARQGAFIVRLAESNTSNTGSLVLELTVKNKKIKQYEKDDNGQWIYEVDEEGNVVFDDAGNKVRVPVTDENGAEVTEDGYELKWTVRPLKLADPNSVVGGATVGSATVGGGTTGDDFTPETIGSLKPVTYGTGDNAYTVYPILAVKATSVGEYANDIGVKLFTDIENLDDTLATNLGALPYTFGLVKKTYGQDTVSAIKTNLGDNTTDFVAKPDQIDSRTARQVSFDDVIGNYYDDLPVDIKLYSENIEEVGTLIQNVEIDDATLVSPWAVNLADPYNINGEPYSHVVMSEDSDAVDLNESRILYLTGGADGNIDDATIETLTRQYLKDLVYPDLLDQPRYPFTHIVDTGVAIDTKYAFINFLGVHDAFKLILSTQDANLGRFNTKAEDLSTGSALYAKCLLQPESIVKGTEVCRAEIYQQAGYLAAGLYKGIIPSTYDIMGKKSLYASTQRITGMPAGLPSSEIDVFKQWNWTPCDADLKQKSWDSGLNYFQHFDMTGIHWPAMRTVYRYDTSVLSSAAFTDAVVYTKHIARYNWSKYAGIELEFSAFKNRATSDLTADLAYMLNGTYGSSVEFTQSEEEAKIGYISHAIITLVGHPQQRVWKIDIECNRSGYSNSEE